MQATRKGKLNDSKNGSVQTEKSISVKRIKTKFSRSADKNSASKVTKTASLDEGYTSPFTCRSSK